MIIAAGVTAGCAPSGDALADQRVDAYIGEPLSNLTDRGDTVADGDVTFMVQDASPRVGERATFSANMLRSSEWTIVNACSDGETIGESKVIEIAVIPTGHDIDEADFSDAIACEWDWVGDD
ncbi:hypothetical protein [Microbacterium karelineae]|uniref:hypothetical protein n=1 Tax=Microbacterium karelineae TaxID=2654283 RepID=UPI0012EA576D|nr:hypothetical protein [Microbacterium karelineae]